MEAALAAAFAIGQAGGSQQKVTDALADATDTYVKTAQVVIPGGSSAGTYPVT